MYMIENPIVWKNLQRLRDHAAGRNFQGDKISLLIDCETGELSIPQPIGDLESSIQMQNMQKKKTGSWRHVELLITSKDMHLSFGWEDLQLPLSEKASGILKATLDLLNYSGRMAQSGLVKEVISQCLRSVKNDLGDELSTNSAWKGSISRLEAEKLLRSSSPGTYLFRKGDDYTLEMEYNLAKQDPLPVRCYVMTLVAESRKMSDFILLQRPNGWALYNDDLELGDYHFKSLEEVIAEAGGVRPLEKKAA